MTTPANDRREPSTRRERTWCPRPATRLHTRQTPTHNDAAPSVLGAIRNLFSHLPGRNLATLSSLPVTVPVPSTGAEAGGVRRPLPHRAEPVIDALREDVIYPQCRAAGVWSTPTVAMGTGLALAGTGRCTTQNLSDSSSNAEAISG